MLKPVLLATLLLVICISAKAQNSVQLGRISYLFTLGPAYNEIKSNAALGLMFGFCRFKNSASNRYRWGINVLHGEYYPYGITDSDNKYYTSTSVGYIFGFDVIKLGNVGIFCSAIASADLYRNVNSKNFYGLQPAVSGGFELGIRVSNPKKRFGFQISYPQIRFGFPESVLAGANVCLEYRLTK